MNKFIIIFILLLQQSFNVFCAEFKPDKNSLSNLSRVQLINELTNLFNSNDAKGSLWGVSVIDANNKNKIFTLNDSKPFRPASNLKIVVAAAALKALSSAYKYQTKLFIDGKIKNNTLHGNLIIQGSGDPTFHLNHFNKWQEALKFYKIESITGDIIAVDSIFDDQKIGILWSWNDLSNCYSAQVSGLQINNNCVGITVEPGKKKGSVAQITKIPNTSYITIINDTKTTNDKNSLIFKRDIESNNLLVKGNIKIDSEKITKWISVNNPTNYFLTLFYNYLIQNGFTISGKISDAKDTGYIINRNKVFLLSTINSVDLKEIINNFLKYSINLYGESLLKTLGFIYFNKGTTYNGRLAINLILKEYKLPQDILFIADGSGLSNLNLISPEYMTDLLISIYKSSYFNVFFNALSVSGMSGTLKRRLNSEYMKGSIHAKTGYIKNVRTLSGYIDTFGNTRLAFAIFANNYESNMKKAELVINQACKLMRRYNNKTGE